MSFEVLTPENLSTLVERARLVLLMGSTLSFEETHAFSRAIIELAPCVENLGIVQARCTELLEENRALRAGLTFR
jgi:hypothetical protein